MKKETISKLLGFVFMAVAIAGLKTCVNKARFKKQQEKISQFMQKENWRKDQIAKFEEAQQRLKEEVVAKTVKDPIVVEQQECVMQHMKGMIPSEDFDIGMMVDVPVEGGQAVTDSIIRFVNGELYDFLESGNKPHFKPKKVYCSDAKQLLQHYYDLYKPFIVDTCYFGEEPLCCFDSHFLSIFLLDQTDTFVTYEVDKIFIGEGVAADRSWVTFCKSDGHRLGEVISTESLLRFFEDCPELQNEIYAELQYPLSEGDKVDWRSHFGLTGTCVMHQYTLAPGIFEDAEYKLKYIQPYLSDEAKILSQTNQENQ